MELLSPKEIGGYTGSLLCLPREMLSQKVSVLPLTAVLPWRHHFFKNHCSAASQNTDIILDLTTEVVELTLALH